MPKPTDIRILEVSYGTQQYRYRAPVKFGGRVVTDALIFDVSIVVETRSGIRGRGYGSMPMGNIWAWPSSRVPADKTLEAMVALATRVAEETGRYRGEGHPLEIAQELSGRYGLLAQEVERDFRLPEPIPRLAQLVAASPVEAALFDAHGKALGQNSYNLLGPEFVSQDLAHFLNEDFAGEYLDRYTLRNPKRRMPLYHLVGALDPLSPGEVKEPIGDGLPESLDQWILFNGLTHLKVKLAGDDLPWDVERMLAVETVAAAVQERRGCTSWWYSADFNERCQNVDYVLEFLAKVKERSPAAYERLQYIEQPTHRDLAAHPENRMHEAAKLKPVVIDESLVDFESLLLARELGYSGVALKACKGHSEALLAAAAAQKYRMFLCVQDLTCPGASFLHSASLSARIPGVAAIEGNARQYCPAANQGWEEAYPGMFRIIDGTVETAILVGPGLGFRHLAELHATQ
jgi:L-alanine-DL-glutamate epimerase-like enolase superfamily enzyme